MLSLQMEILFAQHHRLRWSSWWEEQIGLKLKQIVLHERKLTESVCLTWLGQRQVRNQKTSAHKERLRCTQRCSANKRGVGTHPRKLAIFKQLQTNCKAKHNKGVGTQFPRVPVPLHPWLYVRASVILSWYFLHLLKQVMLIFPKHLKNSAFFVWQKLFNWNSKNYLLWKKLLWCKRSVWVSIPSGSGVDFVNFLFSVFVHDV